MCVGHSVVVLSDAKDKSCQKMNILKAEYSRASALQVTVLFCCVESRSKSCVYSPKAMQREAVDMI